MNWGHAIIIVFVLFAIGILTLVTRSMQTRIDMVTPDYYAEELKYQSTIDARNNTGDLSAPVSVRQPGDSIELAFPGELKGAPLQGKVHFYRPSDSRKDFTLPLSLDDTGRLLVSRTQFEKGPYRIKMQWQFNGKDYFHETQFYVQ